MYATKFRIRHRDPHQDKLWTLLIQENDYTGSFQDISGRFSFGLDQPDAREWWNQQVLKTTVEIEVYLNSDMQRDFFLSEIINQPLSKYRVRVSDGSGLRALAALRSDTVRIAEDSLQRRVLVEASDFLMEKAEDYGLFGSVQSSLISLLASLTAYDLPLVTINNFGATGITATDDFFDKATIDRFHLRRYVSGGEDEPLTKYEAIQQLLPHGCFIFQEGGEYRIYQVPYVLDEQGSGLRKFNYDSFGVLQSSVTNATLTRAYNNNTDFQRPDSVREYYGGFSRLSYTYQHQQLFAAFELDPTYVNVQGQTKVELLELPDIEGARISVSGSVEIYSDTSGQQQGRAFFSLEAGVDPQGGLSEYYYDFDNSQWVSGSIKNIPTGAFTGSGDILTGGTNFTTPPIPTGVSNQILALRFKFAEIDGAPSPDAVRFRNFTARAASPNAFDNSAEIEYRIEPDPDYPFSLELNPKRFGIGPTSFARSAFRGPTGGNLAGIRDADDTVTGETMGAYTLKQINAVQGEGLRIWRPTLISDYEFGEVILYDGTSFLLLSGKFDPAAGELSRTFAVKTDFTTRGDVIRQTVYPPREVSPLRDPGGIVADATITPDGKIRKQVEIEPGGDTGTISDYAKRVDQTVDSDFKIKNSVEVEPDGADGTLSKKLSPITADGRISKDAEVEVGGADGTLSKRTKSLSDAGVFKEMQANETVAIAATSRIDDVNIGDAVLLSIEVDSGVVAGKVSISGISNVIPNRILYIFAKDRDLPLLHENTNSLASNRFDLPGGANVEIPAGAFACCMYINFRWRVQQLT